SHQNSHLRPQNNADLQIKQILRSTLPRIRPHRVPQSAGLETQLHSSLYPAWGWKALPYNSSGNARASAGGDSDTNATNSDELSCNNIFRFELQPPPAELLARLDLAAGSIWVGTT